MFVLSKWYCDCVSDEGIAFVGYWARLRWGLLAIPYAATLLKPLDDCTRERRSLRECAEPSLQDGGLRWECQRLGIRAAWTAGVPAIQGSASYHIRRGTYRWWTDTKARRGIPGS